MSDANLYGVQTIANLLTITPRRVQQLVKEGVLPREESGQYDLIKVVQAYIRHLTGGGVKEGLAEAQLRKAVGDADKIELDLEIRRGELVSVKEVTRVWAKACGEMRSGLLHLPVKVGPVARQAKSDAEAQGIVEKSVYEALSVLSSVEVDVAADKDSAKGGNGDSPTAAKTKGKRVGRSKTTAKSRGKRAARAVGHKQS
jgi:hypothetical protein